MNLNKIVKTMAKGYRFAVMNQNGNVYGSQVKPRPAVNSGWYTGEVGATYLGQIAGHFNNWRDLVWEFDAFVAIVEQPKPHRHQALISKLELFPNTRILVRHSPITAWEECDRPTWATHLYYRDAAAIGVPITHAATGDIVFFSTIAAFDMATQLEYDGSNERHVAMLKRGILHLTRASAVAMTKRILEGINK